MGEGYVQVYSPEGPQEVMLIKMALDSAGIRYFIADENTQSILPVPGLVCPRLMVAPRDVDACLQILREELGLGGAYHDPAR